MAVNESLSRRVKLRFDCECRVRWRKGFTYKRLRSAAVLLDAPNVEQAELFLETMHAVARELNGKWLAPKPSETSDGSAVDSQATSDSKR